MRRSALCAAWCLAVAPLALEHLGGAALGFARGSRLGLVWMIWIAVASLPPLVDPADAPRDGRAGFCATLGVAAPSIALAVWLDRREFAAASELARVLAFGACFLALALVAARAAARSVQALRGYAVLWLAGYVLAPLLRVALEWGSQQDSARAPRWLDGLADASPLAWCYSLAERAFQSTAPSPWPWSAFALALLVSAVAPRVGTSAR